MFWNHYYLWWLNVCQAVMDLIALEFTSQQM